MTEFYVAFCLVIVEVINLDWVLPNTDLLYALSCPRQLPCPKAVQHEQVKPQELINTIKINKELMKERTKERRKERTHVHLISTLHMLLYTWTSPDDQYQNQIEYILCSWRWKSSIQSANTRPGADCGWDHELLTAKFRLKMKKIGEMTREGI